ncbi:MAG: HupE/UreJ family protein [Pelagimonas sp.]|jgi:hypothetical protein|nr:HupE/UreJ family protein [Pelagimonas sp.]
MSSLATAHEMRPAIGDLRVTGSQLVLDLTLNAEALLAEVDLNGIADTDLLERTADVDALRLLTPDALRGQINAFAPDLIQDLAVQANGAPVDLVLQGIDVPEVGNPELPRETHVTLTAALPAGSSTVALQWPAENGVLILRQQGVEDGYSGYLEGGAETGPIQISGGDAKGAGATFAQYIPVGFDHILPKGLDHILFVLGLFFLSARLGPLLWQVSAFTLAHTVTLALGALGIVSIPGSIVEPLIAASIVFVAVENLMSDRLHRWRPLIIFGFGLLHGLGFASVLGEFGLPAGQFVPALIGFNIGVEIGQLTVIAIGAVLVWILLMALKPRLVDWPTAHRAVARPGSLLIAIIGLWWVVERVFL